MKRFGEAYEALQKAKQLGHRHPENVVGGRRAFPDAEDVAWLATVTIRYTGLKARIETVVDERTGHAALRVEVDDPATGKRWATAVSQPVAERNERGIYRYFKTYGWPEAKPVGVREILDEAERAFADE